MILIKKYSNRRLYNTDSSNYITQEDVVMLIKQEKKFKIQDAESKKDITSSILTQILLDRENSGSNLIPQEFLKEIIMHHENDKVAEMHGFLNKVLNFANANSLFSKGFDSLIRFNPFDFQKYINSINEKKSDNYINKDLANDIVDKNLEKISKSYNKKVCENEKKEILEFDKNEQTSKILTKLDKKYKNNIKAREKTN